MLLNTLQGVKMQKYKMIVAIILIMIFMDINCMAQNQTNNPKTNKEKIFTIQAPKPIGPYSQAIKVGNTLYVSGQIALDKNTNNLIQGGTSTEAKVILDNIKAIVEKANFTMEDIVKVTIYLKNLDDFSKVNEIYETYFKSGNYPARETVEVSRLPKGANIEISVIASK